MHSLCAGNKPCEKQLNILLCCYSYKELLIYNLNYKHGGAVMDPKCSGSFKTQVVFAELHFDPQTYIINEK